MVTAIKSFFRNYYVQIILWLFIFSIVGLVFSDFYYKFFDFANRSPKPANREVVIAAFHAVEITILTFILVVVAWGQLASLNKTGKADFLLRLDERFSGDEVLEARTYIHKLYIQFRPSCNHSRFGSVCNTCHVKHMQDIRDAIKNIRHDKKLAKTFVQLKGLLELFESIGYFSGKGHVDFGEVDHLLGGIIEFHYEVFMDWIHYLQDTKGKENFSEFERLVHQINPCLIPESRRSAYK